MRSCGRSAANPGDRRSTFDHRLQHATPTEFVEHLAEVAVEFHARLHPGIGRHAAEHDAQRVPPVGVAHGERGIVDADRARADDDRIALRA